MTATYASFLVTFVSTTTTTLLNTMYCSQQLRKDAKSISHVTQFVLPSSRQLLPAKTFTQCIRTEKNLSPTLERILRLQQQKLR